MARVSREMPRLGHGGACVTTVVVVGLGYVGLPLALRTAEVGHRVAGYDTDKARVKSLKAGESYVEDVPSGELKQALEGGMFRPSADAGVCAGFDVAVVATPTPLRDGLPDLTYLEDSARTLARYLRPGATVVVESTSYPGTTQEKVLPRLEEGSGLVAGRDFHLGFSPERIDPGNLAWTLVTTPKIVSGIDQASLEAIRAFYDTVVDRTVTVSSPREAELAKLVENTFRHVNIALVNELAMYAHDLDIDVWEAIDAASTKPFGFMPFTPGPGVGGHCLPIDPSYLSWRVERAGQALPLRRAGRRYQQPHAGLRGAPDQDVVQRHRAPGQRRPHPVARPGVQEEHGGCAGIAGGARFPVAGGDGGAIAGR
jgi:UDP-N-acetyl-D-glucosamine dehydrogenase